MDDLHLALVAAEGGDGLAPAEYSDTAVRPLERSIENFVIVRNDGSCPISVMSVPWSVVMICTELPESSSISRAIQALVACGIA